MLEFMVFLLPSVLGLKIFMSLNKNKSIFEYVVDYFLFVLFTNFLSMFIINNFNKGVYNIVEYCSSDLSFAVRYIFTAILLNIILPVVFTVIIKYITFDVEVENERKVKKNTKRN